MAARRKTTTRKAISLEVCCPFCFSRLYWDESKSRWYLPSQQRGCSEHKGHVKLAPSGSSFSVQSKAVGQDAIKLAEQAILLITYQQEGQLTHFFMRGLMSSWQVSTSFYLVLFSTCWYKRHRRGLTFNGTYVTAHATGALARSSNNLYRWGW
jgi:hypothetical protein